MADSVFCDLEGDMIGKRHQPARLGGKRRPWKAVLRTILVATLVCIGTPAQAVVVVVDGKKVTGYLHSVSDTHVVLDELLPDGQLRRKSILRSSQVLVLNSVKPEVLEGLREDNPRGYRNYADDLKVKREDPDCRRTAIRLYLIAAYLDPENHGKGCLSSMATLASSPEEQRRFHSMAYLLDPKHDRGILKMQPVKATTITLSDEDRSSLRRGLRAFWSGRKADAVGYANRSEFREALARASTDLTIEEFQAGAGRRGSWLPPTTLRKVLLLEQSVSPARSLAAATSMSPERSAGSWSTIEWKAPAVSTAELSLETITDFDPRKTRFRNKKWTVPEE